MMREIPYKLLIPFLMEWEGYTNKVYKDAAGVPTWGIGHADPGAKIGDAKTKDEIDAAFYGDAERARLCVYAGCGDEAVAALTPYQYTALLSFAFNTGAPKSANLWKLVRAKEYKLVPANLMLWDHAGGQVIKGLYSRRHAEVLLWNRKE
jgi:lysozyme